MHPGGQYNVKSNISGTEQCVKLELYGKVEGYVKTKIKTLWQSRLSKGRLCNIPETAKGIMLEIPGHIVIELD